ncbi:MAG: hypothetical protein AAB434_13145 [Planctomycetota bacterium]
MLTVIHVPGGMGSELIDAKGRRVWGRVRSFLRPPSRTLMLPDGGALRPGGVVTRVRAIPRLWEVSLYHKWLLRLADAGFRYGAFAYDWRRPMEETAEALEAFIASIDGDVALVSHSQGGLAILRALQRGAITPRVRCALLVGLPMPGSFWAYRCMFTGLRPVRIGGSISPEAMRSFRSAWDQVPPSATMVDLDRDETYTVDLHSRGPWYPFEGPLEEVRRAHEALRTPLPDGVPVHALSSTGFPTPCGFVMRKGKVAFPSQRECRRRGWPLYHDGDASVPPLPEGPHPLGMTVHRLHALHRYAFNDAGVQEKLLALLREHIG